MPKTKKRGRRRQDEAWTGADHLERSAKSKRRQEEALSHKERRAQILTHDTKEKRQTKRLKLHITKTKREVDALRQRLERWDDVKEEQKRKEQARSEAARKQKEAEEADLGSSKPKKRRVRPGPETWKLRGAARPASEVYDFDTRYVDPHMRALEEARQEQARARNLLAVYRGNFGSPSAPPECRRYLSLLMQLGMLHVEAKQYKAARQRFLECMELDSTPTPASTQQQPITLARCRLMRLYLEANRPESARRLWEKLPSTDRSVWIRYSAALIEYVSWNILQENGSTRESAERLLIQAIQANVFCAYYLAFRSHFQKVMEYVEEVEDATDEEPLEEAIEYCNSEQMDAWLGTEGALEWVRQVILRGLRGQMEALPPSDLECQDKLTRLEREGEEANELQAGNDANHYEDEEDDAVDVVMFVGMFRTAMEMLSDSDQLKEAPKAIADDTDGVVGHNE